MKKISYILMPFISLSFLANCGKSNTYTVSFDTNDGTPSVEPQKVKEGDYAKDPEIVVTRDKEALKYWSLQDEEDPNPTAFMFSTTKITSDITLHAIFDGGPQPTPPSEIEMNFKCLSDTASLYAVKGNKADADISLQYSNDLITWENVAFDEELYGNKFHKFSLKKDEVIYLRGDNQGGLNENLVFTTMEEDGELSVSGNALSLIQKTNFSSITTIPEKCFVNLFENNLNLVDASNLLLPITLSENCFWGMFESCNSLVKAPALPATTLSNSCYYCMFKDCSSLIEAPNLPATTLVDFCYADMFSNCSSLLIPPNLLNVKDLATNCYFTMFNGSGLQINTKGDGTKFFQSPSEDKVETYAHYMFNGSENPLPDTAYYYTTDN